jgi:ABC-type bacteriocin/lantibiotic exporter with double-glycine peptidase domain
VDAGVAEHIVRNCLLSGPLGGRTRIIGTHQLDLLRYADWVIVMEKAGYEGRIAQQGTYAVGWRVVRC